jgi:ABC-2 type transport system ATP-binding protein
LALIISFNKIDFPRKNIYICSGNTEQPRITAWRMFLVPVRKDSDKIVGQTTSAPIRVENLVKNYGDKIAVRGLSFEVRPGEIYGLLGPNGAGKSTTLKIVTGLLDPTEGSTYVYGLSPVDEAVKVKSMLGYVPETVQLYDSLSIREFLQFVASVRRMAPQTANTRARELIRAFDLEKYFDTPTMALSAGTKQKVAVISALIDNPPLLILDEPMSGLDVRSSRILKDHLTYHTNRGGAVLFSTHIMEVAEHICSRVGIINQGTLVAEGTVTELRDLVHQAGASLEEIFLHVTAEEEGVAETIKVLEEAFRKP